MFCCRLHHRQTEAKKEERRELKMIRRGWAAVRYSSCQAGTGSEGCVGENNRFSKGALTVDAVFFVV